MMEYWRTTGRSAFSLPEPEILQKEKNAGPPKKTAAQLS
jgi:hypothetical protein